MTDVLSSLSSWQPAGAWLLRMTVGAGLVLVVAVVATNPSLDLGLVATQAKDGGLAVGLDAKWGEKLDSAVSAWAPVPAVFVIKRTGEESVVFAVDAMLQHD